MRGKDYFEIYFAPQNGSYLLLYCSLAVLFLIIILIIRIVVFRKQKRKAAQSIEQEAEAQNKKLKERLELERLDIQKELNRRKEKDEAEAKRKEKEVKEKQELEQLFIQKELSKRREKEEAEAKKKAIELKEKHEKEKANKVKEIVEKKLNVETDTKRKEIALNEKREKEKLDNNSEIVASKRKTEADAKRKENGQRENKEFEKTNRDRDIAAQNKRITSNPYLASSEIEIKIIKSVPEPANSEPKRIGYLPNTKFSNLGLNNYAIVKMPMKNCIIKFPRKGRSDKKGFKEDEFFVQLNGFFKNHFGVFNNRHIPTENGRPYEPDFILINEKGNKNIFINIEIDEPYDGWMRTPTHCIGENDIRDDFFNKRGWIVIRFAEIQIQREPKNCCALVAKVIASIDPTFYSELLSISNPTSIEQWDTIQAKKWAANRYRENYLGILSFGQRPNVIFEYEILDSDTDRTVEKQVPKPDSKLLIETGQLSKKNWHERDNRITFDPIEHRYYIDGNPDTISVTQLVDKFFPEFDALYWAPIKAAQRGISSKELVAEWEAKRIDSANKGTALHKDIENYYNGESHNANTPEFKQFHAFIHRYNSMTPHRSEWRIFDEDLLIAGTIDMVYRKPDGTLYMFDWKRSEKVVKNDGSIKNDTFQFASGMLGHLGDNSYNKYCLQQNLYKAILEKRYNQKISSMNLLVMHEMYDNYHLVKIPNMQNEVNYIFNYNL